MSKDYVKLAEERHERALQYLKDIDSQLEADNLSQIDRTELFRQLMAAEHLVNITRHRWIQELDRVN